jgi:hypothetical protein
MTKILNFMEKNKFIISVLFLFFLCFQTWSNDSDAELNKIKSFFQVMNNYSKIIPHEKVFLHFDNTNYYQGDSLWFKCYVVTSGQHQLSELSKTLYVELLNPGGEIIDKKILRVESGQCHGSFSLNHLPFYSGFYEVRAYTKYMLNYGDDVIFSRLLPVFDIPKTEGDFEEKRILSYNKFGPAGNYTMKREQPEKYKNVNMRFYPEGGNLVRGIESRVAFEATDEDGIPIDVTGVILNSEKQELCSFNTIHEGRGIFTYTPGDSRQKDIVEVEYSGKKYRFDLPKSLPQGIIMEVNNPHDDKLIDVILRKNEQTTAEMLGVVVMSGGKVYNYCGAYLENVEAGFNIDKTLLPSGVSQIVLFNSKGEILCDRLVFNINNDNLLDIKVKTNKQLYFPFESAQMEISVTDKDSNPVDATFSISVRDGDNEVEYGHNILTDLLLMSEIKGYVRNPSFYFEKDGDENRHAALDLLLMVQGWRRYSWSQMAGVEPFDIDYLPEKGIETTGKIFSSIRQKPQPNVDIGVFLVQRGKEDDDTNDGFFNTFKTDDNGRFSVVTDVEGKWSMILTLNGAGKKKDHDILLDRLFSPKPKKYNYSDLKINIAENNEEVPVYDEDDEDTDDSEWLDYDAYTAAYRDSLARLGLDQRTIHLKSVTVTAKRPSDILHNRSTSVAYYDVPNEFDNLYDSRNYVGKDMHKLLMNMNGKFSVVNAVPEAVFKELGVGDIITPFMTGVISIKNPASSEVQSLSQKMLAHRNALDFIPILEEFLLYNNKMTFFVINHKPIDGFFDYNTTRIPAIKSIYINEESDVISQYAFPKYSQSDGIQIGCIVFIETFPEGEIPVDAKKGVRKTWFEGYSKVEEYYNVNHSSLPENPDPDYRRTLYWNPSIKPDETGKAMVMFYNNSSCKQFNINIEAVTQQGHLGAYKQ